MKSLAEIRALMKAEEERAKSIKEGNFNTGPSEPDAFLAFWNIPEGQILNFRFVEDANTDNPYFWRERDMIRLTFKGVRETNGTISNTNTVQLTVPCNEMWVPKSCPVLQELREWYKVAEATGNEELKKRANAYWKKRSYLLQGFIAPDSVQVKDDMPPENPIRRVLFSKPLFTKVKSILMNVGIKESPTHVEHGRDFSIIRNVNGGGFNNYDESQFSMVERPLNDREREALNTYGAFDLGKFMPEQPTPEQLNAIREMFEASVDEQPYDVSRWAEFYRPAGVMKPNVSGNAATIVPPATKSVSSMASTVAQQVATQAVTPVAEPVAPAPAAQTEVKTKSNATDLLNRIKSRNQ